VQSAKVTVVALGHEEYPDTEIIQLQGSPRPTLIETLHLISAIGSVTGVVPLVYRRPSNFLVVSKIGSLTEDRRISADSLCDCIASDQHHVRYVLRCLDENELLYYTNI
jgi:hypothetical protein